MGTWETIKLFLRRDRMSDLPDSIILHILSFMDAKDAVRSGILAKRFAYLWTEVPCLNFEQSTLEIVDTTVCFHKRSNLEKLSVSFCREGESYDEKEIKIWRFIRLLGFSGVKELVLDIEPFYRYSLPLHFYSNPTLKKLSLTHGHLQTNGFVNWKLLQSLSLTDVCLLHDHAIKDIVSGCPSVEFLSLTGCSFLGQINLTNNRCLRKLVIDKCFRIRKLEISATNLQSLVLLRYTKCFTFKILNVNSMTDACLDFYQAKHLADEIVMRNLSSLLDDLSHIETLTVGEWGLQILSLMEVGKLPCPLSKTVKFLKLRSNFTADDITAVAYLLRNLNLLEELVLEIRHYDERYFLPHFRKQHQVCLKNESYCSSEIMENLKTVEILGLSEDEEEQFPYDLNDIFLLVEFLLKNAKFLENMTITARGSTHYLVELMDKLLGFPRSSPSAVVKIIHC